MHFEYKGHHIAITETIHQYLGGICRIRIDDGNTADYIGTFSDAISSAKQWIDTGSGPIVRNALRSVLQ